MPNDPARDSLDGQAIYVPWVLAVYDWYVLRLSNSLVWRCPSRRMLDWYNRHVASQHLDIGVGTGWFLDHCRYPSPDPKLTLLDLNPNSLRHASKRIARYEPITVQADVLAPLPAHLGKFQSIGLNFLLHCLPEQSLQLGKWDVFAQLSSHLTTGGVLFGSTILGTGTTASQRLLLNTYNHKGIFGNRHDTRAKLEDSLRQSFKHVETEQHGLVVLFAARND